MKNQDSLIGVFLIAFCAFVLWLTTGFDEVPPMLSQNVPPTFFPRLVLTIIALLSVALTLGNLRKPALKNAGVKPAVFVTAGIVLVTGLSLGYLGTWLTLILVAVILPLAWGERRLVPIGLLAGGLPVSVYLVFSIALGVRFPAGRLFESFF